ncbi:MAG: DUF1801 domain-containing protein [Pirellulaceae bacterium]|nr:DUF1801 domain-containing protein [Pirellulaceae bacterium]
MQSKATTVEQYLAELPEDRRAAVQALREVILANLQGGYEEGMQYGMIGYYVPHSIYPAGYHCDPKQPLPLACVASQKNYLAVYLSCLYSQPEFDAWFRGAWTGAGKKLDMGKGCVRFKRIGDVPLEVLGQAIARVPVPEFIRIYETARESAGRHGRSTKKASSTEETPVKKAPAKKAQARQTTAKKAASRPTPAKKAPVKKASAVKPSVKKMTSSKGAAQPAARTARSTRKK